MQIGNTRLVALTNKGEVVFTTRQFSPTACKIASYFEQHPLLVESLEGIAGRGRAGYVTASMILTGITLLAYLAASPPTKTKYAEELAGKLEPKISLLMPGADAQKTQQTGTSLQLQETKELPKPPAQTDVVQTPLQQFEGSLEDRQFPPRYYAKLDTLAKNFARETVKYSRFWAHIEAASNEFGIDKNLLCALIFIESGCDPSAISKSDARGLVQVKEGTAKFLKSQYPGVFSGKDAEDFMVPQQNLRFGSLYLRRQLDRFKNPAISLMAYRSGGGNAADKISGKKEFEAIDYDYAQVALAVYKFFSAIRFADAVGALARGQMDLSGYSAAAGQQFMLIGPTYLTSFDFSKVK